MLRPSHGHDAEGRGSSTRAQRAWVMVPLAFALAAIVAGCGSSPSRPATPGQPSTSTSASPSPATSPSTLTAPRGAQGPLRAPAIPAHGAYLGAWVNPAHLKAASGQAASAELTQLSTIQGPLGRPLAVLHAYTSWTAPAPVAALQQISATGATPMLDWACGADASINSGSDDGLITSYADALKGYGKPVFLRYAWEMNLRSGTNAHCAGSGGPSGFVAAWQRVYRMFHAAGATNVAFVWCPGVSGGNFQAFYPGASAVDWIGIDGYDRTHLGSQAFASVFGAFYQQFATQGKPLAVAETGAQAIDQAAFVTSLGTVLPEQFPQVKALIYFDAPGPAGNWALQDGGLQAFAALSHLPYFSIPSA